MLRAVLVVFALAANLWQWDGYQRPVLGVAVVAGLVGWSGLATWFYAVPRRRYRWVLAADVGAAVGALVATPYVLGAATLAESTFTVPTYWIAAPVLACAIRGGWRGGLVASVIVGAVDIAIRSEPLGPPLGNVFLLCLAATVVGYCASLVVAAAAERAEATAVAAATAERERLSRAVHDGVLQVLAYVQRRGTEIGGSTRELADLAGEQEAALRGLVRSRPDGLSVTSRTTDLAASLQQLTGATVSVAAPGEPVSLPVGAAGELVAATREAVGNAVYHAPGSSVYVLVEEDADAVTVSVRDDGPGIPAGRLDEAARSGRLGVRDSIVGRLESLGGEANLHTDGEGTEWELRVPRSLNP